MRAVATIALVTAFGFTIISSAVAEGGRGTKQEQEACTPDVYKLCSNEIPDEKKIEACLRRNKSKLSPACRKVFDE